MKHQALFAFKDKSKKTKVSSASILFGTLMVKQRQIMGHIRPIDNIVHR